MTESDFDEFLMTLRDALLMIVRWIERRHNRRQQQT
jgi:hypothetical protein